MMSPHIQYRATAGPAKCSRRIYMRSNIDLMRKVMRFFQSDVNTEIVTEA